MVHCENKGAALKAPRRKRAESVFFLCGLLVACMSLTVGSASVINDVNNMLRDNGGRSADNPDSPNSGYVTNVKRHSARPSAQSADGPHAIKNTAYDGVGADEGGGLSNDLDSDSSVELLRFVDDDNDNGEEVVMLRDSNSPNFKASQATTAKRSTANGESTPVITDADGDNDADDDDGGEGVGVGNEENLSLTDQVRLLATQMNALMTRRREDYALLERNLRNSLKSTKVTNAASSDLCNELEQLRREVKQLQDGRTNDNKERLTVEWLQQSVAELRKQIVELQQIASSAVRDVNRRTQTYEDLDTVRNDFQELKLELAALKERQQQNDVYIRELREEVLQQEEDYKRLFHNWQLRREDAAPQGDVHDNELVDLKAKSNSNEKASPDKENELSDTLLADHKRRHSRFQHQQIHELQVAQRSLKRQLNELKYHRIGERMRSMEIEQHRMADANFNLSRQIASLDKLHASVFELLEDVEGLQNRMDKSIPELRHEISKLEFVSAQLTSEQSLLREEGKNVARSVQAMAVSVSTLQDERANNKQTQASVSQLRANVDRLQSMMDDVQRALVQSRRALSNKLQQKERPLHHHQQQQQQLEQLPEDSTEAFAKKDGPNAESLVAKLEDVEQQYESIVRNLPQDCMDVSNGREGVYMIAPAGQHRPLMAHCSAEGWTTVQRRFDGSTNFNRSWEDYAGGFGAPSGEYWIGNEQLHHLTRSNCSSLRVLMQDIYDNVWLAEYDHFYISSRADGYRLDVGGYHGNASNALDYQQGMQFSAIDVDRDISQTHCAANYEGGWWFSHCQHANLNGLYNLGLTWFDASRNEWIAVKSSQMLVKRHTIPGTATSACSYSAPEGAVTPTGDAAADAVGAGVAMSDSSLVQAQTTATATTTATTKTIFSSKQHTDAVTTSVV